MMEQYLTYIFNPWVYWIFTFAYFVTVVSIVGVVLSENRNPLKSLAWITVLLLLPAGGILLYLFFGRSIKNKRMISRRNRRRLLQAEDMKFSNPSLSDFKHEYRQQIELGRSLSGATYFPGNQIKLFFNGKEKFESLKIDLQAATKTINLQYYIFEDDKIGTEIADILIAKARQGVKVRVIYDHIGSIHVRNKFFKRMSQAGVEIHPFFRVVFPIFATRINWRNHRKICVIDGQIGYIGGMNIADRYINGGKFAMWRDTHMRIEGPAVNALHYSFAVDWNFMGQPLIEDTTHTTDFSTSHPDTGGIQLLTSGPTSEWSNIEFQMLKAIGNARKRVYIQTPYFLPTESLLRALQAAALARVDVRIMMPRKSDSHILNYASYSYVYECLRAGIKIYFFDAGMLHSKTMLIDDEFCAIGSANIDFRSFEHNFESTMFIYSEVTNRTLRKQFHADEQKSTRIRQAAWRNRPITQKAAESILRLLSPIL